MTVGIVTGAGRGMGAACADRVKDMVDVLVLVDRDETARRRRGEAVGIAGARHSRDVRPRRQRQRRPRAAGRPGGRPRPATRGSRTQPGCRQRWPIGARS